MLNQKKKLNFAVNVAEWIHHSFSFYLMYRHVAMECTDLNRLCKHMKKVRSSQVSISIKSCTEMSMSKTLVFFVRIVKLVMKTISYELRVASCELLF